MAAMNDDFIIRLAAPADVEAIALEAGSESDRENMAHSERASVRVV